MIEYRLISIREVLLKGWLLRKHYEEVAKNKGLMVLAPDALKYEQLEEAGNLFTVGAYLGGDMGGYSVNVVSNHLHYRHLLVCQNDVIFVHEAYRSCTTMGLRLMTETRRHARVLGAELMLWHAKSGSSLDKLLARRRMTAVQDIIYSEEL